MEKLTAEQAQSKTIAELETYLDMAVEHFPKSHLKEIMAIRNAKIEEDQLDHWGLTRDQYATAKAEAIENEQPLASVLNEYRKLILKEARKAQTASVGSATVGTKGVNTR